jgi:hypothetical protein
MAAASKAGMTADGRPASQEDTMTMLKPALCAAALVAAAAVAIPAIAQQSPQGDAPSATQPATPPQAGPDGRQDWRGDPRGRYSDEDGPRWRRGEGRRFGRDEDDDGPRRWRERRFGGPREGMMPPMMERGATMRPFGMAHVCGPEGARIGEMMMDRVERATQPTTEQRPGFDRLKEAAGKAGEIMRGACTTERPVTPTGRLAAAEKRLAAMLDAVRTVRPALDAYYGSLTDEQKARLTLAQPHMGRPGMGGGWRERLNRWREHMHRDEPRGDRTENAQPGDESEKL